MNPINMFKSWLWTRGYERTPITRIGAMLVKDYNECLYCVGYDEVLLETIRVLETLPHDRFHGPVVALLEKLVGPRD